MSNPFTPKRTEPHAIGRGRAGRRSVARQRHHHCGVCGYERRSWLDLRSCPSCGSSLTTATDP